MNFEVTVIIPTLKRTESIGLLLSSLKSNGEYIREIIIVEQVENNGNAFKALGNKLGLNVKYIFLPEASTSHAKNVGAKEATSDIILFLDDDVVAEKGLIQNHLDNYDDPSVGAVCGRSITVGQKVEAHRRDTGRISYLCSFSDGYSSTIKQEIDTVIGCNASWRKKVFDQIGGFDEQFTGNAMREESDLSLRAKKAGYKIIFEPQALVTHTRADSGGARKTEGRMKWYFDFFSNETYFFLKHRPALLLPLYLLKKIEWAVRCSFGFGREVSITSMITPTRGIIDGIRKFTTQ